LIVDHGVVSESAVPALSYDELAGRLAEALAALERANAVIAEQDARIAELEARLGQNPGNSSRPPSSQGLDKPAPKSLRKKGQRRPGRPAGQPGSTLEVVADPKRAERHEPACCRGCGSDLAGAAEAGFERRQVFDLPPVEVEVVEHRLVRRRCGCGVVTRADAPEQVAAAVQYGPRVRAVCLYLYAGQFLSAGRTATALEELFGLPVTARTVLTMARRAADRLEPLLERVRTEVAAAPVAHFDETGFRVQGRLHWVHSASTGKWSLITVHRKRGTEAMNAAGVLPHFGGTAVHDAWAPYDTYTTAAHALCNAHLLRELQYVIDNTPDGQWCWAEQATDALLEMKTLVDAALAGGGLDRLDPTALDARVKLFHDAAVIGANDTKDRAGKLQAKFHALATRITRRQDDYLRFTRDERVPFTNNAAEGEIRMIKLRQKVSGCMRTLAGAEQFCAIRSYLATARKHAVSFFTALAQLAEGRPWLPETA
jgi:transposase